MADLPGRTTEKPIALPLFLHQSARPMDQILPYLPKGFAFEPHDLMAMAFDDVCKALKVAASNSKARETIAERIIELARRGAAQLHWPLLPAAMLVDVSFFRRRRGPLLH